MSNRRWIIRKEKELERKDNINRDVKERRGWAQERKGKTRKKDYIRKETKKSLKRE
jgi:hypothetical protein